MAYQNPEHPYYNSLHIIDSGNPLYFHNMPVRVHVINLSGWNYDPKFMVKSSACLTPSLNPNLM